MSFSIDWLFLFTLATGVFESTYPRFVRAELKSLEWTPIKAQKVEEMYNNSFMSDIKFTFENNDENVFFAHKYVLALSSPVFYDMFYRQDEKPIQTIRLPYNSKDIARFFGYIYKDDCPKIHEKYFNALRLMIKYKVHLHPDCQNSLQRDTDSQTAFKFVEEFLELKADVFAEICLRKIDAFAENFFASESFLNIKQSTLNILLDRDTLYLNETDIFKAVLKWADHQIAPEINRAENRRRVLGNAIYSIRFLLMTQGEFVKDVISTNILHDKEAMDIIRLINGEDTQNTVWDSKKIKTERHRGQFHAEIQDSVAAEKPTSSMTDYVPSALFTTLIVILLILICKCYFPRGGGRR